MKAKSFVVIVCPRSIVEVRDDDAVTVALQGRRNLPFCLPEAKD